MVFYFTHRIPQMTGMGGEARHVFPHCQHECRGSLWSVPVCLAPQPQAALFLLLSLFLFGSFNVAAMCCCSTV